MAEELKIGRRTVGMSHPDKVLFPQAKVTKRDLARHYEAVAPAMLPYVKDRPLALQAFPNGVEQHGFFMKAVPDYFPGWVDRVTVPKKGGTVTHALANDAATLVYLAGQNVVTPHTWLSKADEPRKPAPPRGGVEGRARAQAGPPHHRLRPLAGRSLRRRTGRGARGRPPPARPRA